jgi:hypothetical protein
LRKGSEEKAKKKRKHLFEFHGICFISFFSVSLPLYRHLYLGDLGLERILLRRRMCVEKEKRRREREGEGGERRKER